MYLTGFVHRNRFEIAGCETFFDTVGLMGACGVKSGELKASQDDSPVAGLLFYYSYNIFLQEVGTCRRWSCGRGDGKDVLKRILNCT